MIHTHTYIYTELGTVLEKCIIDTIKITHFFSYNRYYYNYLKKIIVDTITHT